MGFEEIRSRTRNGGRSQLSQIISPPRCRDVVPAGAYPLAIYLPSLGECSGLDGRRFVLAGQRYATDLSVPIWSLL